MRAFLSILYAVLLAALAAGEVLYVEWVVPARKFCATAQRVAMLNPPTLHRARIVFGGDVMAHTPQLTAAQTAEGYSFDRSFEYVAPMMQQADLAIVNLETTLSRRAPYTGYPMFRAPSELAVTLQGAGVDAVALANNHICDRGSVGLRSTIEIIDSLGIKYTGAYYDSLSRQPLYLSAAGITLAVLNYTYGTNGLPTPRGMVVNRIDTVQMAADIASIDRSQADAVCVMVHWGEEYHPRPSKVQREMADWLYRHGATVIVGGHPHVVQPVEVLTDRWGRTRGVTFYSLGNYVSNQSMPGTDGGMVVTLHFRQEEGDMLEIAADWDFVWTHRGSAAGRRTYRVLPLSEAQTAVKDTTAWRASRFERSCRRFRTADTVIVGRGFVRLN